VIIKLGTTFLLLITAVVTVSAERLPEHKCGTIAILKTLNGKAGGMAPEQLDIKRFTRPSASYTYDTPQGHFKVHYDLTGINAVDSVGYVYKIGDYFERSWTAYIDTMGYLPPPPDGGLGGDDRYDVYLKHLGSYGLTYPGSDGPQPWDDLTSYIEIENDFDNVYSNDDPDGFVAGAMKVTCAHEFHHAVQFGLRGSSTAWCAEMTSVSMEERLYPYVNDYIWLIDYLMESPHLPLDWNFGYHMYGMGLYAQYWNRAYGDGFLYSVWDTMRFLPDMVAIHSTCSDYSTTLFEDLCAFAARAFLTGPRDCGFFPDGSAFSDMTVENTHINYPAAGGTSCKPYGYGINYIVFENFDTADCDLGIDFDGDSTVDWAVTAIWKSSDSAAFFDVDFDSRGSGEVRVPFVNDAEFVALAIVPAGTTAARYDYSYTADILPASIEIEEQRQKLPEDLTIEAYPNPFNSAVTIALVRAQHAAPLPTGIEIYDINGQLVYSTPSPPFSLWEKVAEGRMRGVVWTPDKSIPSGVYFAKAQIGGKIATKKFVFMK